MRARRRFPFIWPSPVPPEYRILLMDGRKGRRLVAWRSEDRSGSTRPCHAPGRRKNLKLMIIKPKVRGFVCVTAHPAGCAAHVAEWISHVKSKGPIKNGPKKALVIGGSTGYGLASRVTAAFGSGAATLGIFYERPSEEGRTATPGCYNTIGFVPPPAARRRALREEHQLRRLLGRDQGAGPRNDPP